MSVQNNLNIKIKEILKHKFSPESFIEVKSSGIRDNLHVVVMSRDFDNMTEGKKQDLLWSMIDDSDLSQEQKLRISMIVPLSPDDVC